MPLLTDIPNYFKKTFKGATTLTKGLIGLVPAPEIGQQNAVLKGNATWASLSASDVGAVASDPSGVTGADAITNIMSLTQAEYDAIGSPNASTLYIITDP